MCVCGGGGGGGGEGEGDILPNNPNIPLEDAGGIRPHIIAPPQMHFLDPPLILYHWLIDYLPSRARCRSVVRAFAHGAMGRRIDRS